MLILYMNTNTLSQTSHGKEFFLKKRKMQTKKYNPVWFVLNIKIKQYIFNVFLFVIFALNSVSFTILLLHSVIP